MAENFFTSIENEEPASNEPAMKRMQLKPNLLHNGFQLNMARIFSTFF